MGNLDDEPGNIIGGKDGVVFLGEQKLPIHEWELTLAPPVVFKRRPIRKVSELAELGREPSESDLRGYVEAKVQDVVEQELGIPSDETILNDTGGPSQLQPPGIEVSPLANAMIETIKEREVELFLKGSWHNISEHVQELSSELTLSSWRSEPPAFPALWRPASVNYHPNPDAKSYTAKPDFFWSYSIVPLYFRKPTLALLAISLRKSYPNLPRSQARKLAQLVRRRAGV